MSTFAPKCYFPHFFRIFLTLFHDSLVSIQKYTLISSGQKYSQLKLRCFRHEEAEKTKEAEEKKGKKLKQSREAERKKEDKKRKSEMLTKSKQIFVIYTRKCIINLFRFFLKMKRNLKK